MNTKEELSHPSPQERFEVAVELALADVEHSAHDEKGVEITVSENFPYTELVENASGGQPEHIHITKRHYITEEGAGPTAFEVNFVEYFGDHSYIIILYISDDMDFRRVVTGTTIQHHMTREAEIFDKLKSDSDAGPIDDKERSELEKELQEIKNNRQKTIVNYEDDPESFEAVLELLQRISP